MARKEYTVRLEVRANLLVRFSEADVEDRFGPAVMTSDHFSETHDIVSTFTRLARGPEQTVTGAALQILPQPVSELKRALVSNLFSIGDCRLGSVLLFSL
jgi:hypothetical protein